MPDHLSTTRFPVAVDAALREAGWQPGRWDIKLAEHWADTLRSHVSPGGHRHTVFPAAVEAWAEFEDYGSQHPARDGKRLPRPYASTRSPGCTWPVRSPTWDEHSTPKSHPRR